MESTDAILATDIESVQSNDNFLSYFFWTLVISTLHATVYAAIFFGNQRAIFFCFVIAVMLAGAIYLGSLDDFRYGWDTLGDALILLFALMAVGFIINVWVAIKAAIFSFIDESIRLEFHVALSNQPRYC